MATPSAAFDIADFVDFGETGMPDVSQEASFGVSETALPQNSLLDEPGELENSDSIQPASAEFNTNFSSWLPTYQKAVQPCEYCRSKSLECFIFNADGSKRSGCSPCNALFRPCSFSNPERMPGMRQRTALDTLDVVAENDIRHVGGLTGKKQMRSLGHLGPIEDGKEDDEGPKKGAAAARFPRAAVKVLKDWMLMHIDHPYPTDEEKETLKQETGLSVGQISNWMANTRRRQKARPKRSASPSLRPSTGAINIPAGKTWESMSTYSESGFTRSHKTLASSSTGKFLTFRSKYDWSRHEKSLHLSLEKWLCAPLGEIVADKATGKPRCVYCDELDPSKEHLATHNHSACYEKGPESRTFYRKDHLRQHLRLMHGCKMTSSMDTWKSEAQYIKSRCGFCGMNFDKWQDRLDHLAKEFRNGAHMKNWKGCRGLDPHVAIHVTNAMPPYLIANESKSPFPFSASNTASLKQLNLSVDSKDLEYLLPNVDDIDYTNNVSAAYQPGSDPSTIGPIVLTTPKDYSPSKSLVDNPNATCWEILTLQLGRFAREHIAKHGSANLTDEVLQAESRRILYDDDDPWNQTSADNPEWLNLFKKAHGINCQTPVKNINGEHEIFEDLGINYGSALDPSFDVSNFACTSMSQNDPLRALSYEFALSGSVGAVQGHARQLSSGRQTPYSVPGLTGSPTSPASYAPITTTSSADNLLGFCEPISELACTGAGTCLGEQGEIGFSIKTAGLPKRRYWLDDSTAHLMPFTSSASEQPTVDGLTTGGPTVDDFQFPSWDQLPEDFQNPTSSADFDSTIPITTTGVSMAAVEGTDAMPWDDMDFAMDLDTDMDMGLNQV
ncbi:uncharacterized protein J4E92_009313 [Alternaria infectoria]|uniref:uncharacterized protein n=1 Tax=Alternaria infectoria TaxID=45303 RepID=UPI00221F7B57|nr:uncharacterized protein J4E92_009313 [Alternaria infectoria]KAI4916396.1 hypothetical protein J4E92_009313 [Alternaria infectoria]